MLRDIAYVPYPTSFAYPASHCTGGLADFLCWGAVLQIVVAGLAVWQLKTGASPWDRLRLLPIFFLGSAELASGLTGL